MDKTGKHTDSLIMGALIMFFSYLMAGMVPIIPTLLLDLSVSRFVSVIFSLLGLFTIGFVKGHIVNEKPLRSAFEMFLIGGVATLIGLAVGYFLKI